MRAYTGKLTLDIVASDPAIQLYLTGRIEKYGRIPITVGTRIRTAAYKFLRLNGIEPSDHAFSDLVAQRRATPEGDRSLEKAPEAPDFKPPISMKFEVLLTTKYQGAVEARDAVKLRRGYATTVASEFRFLCQELFESRNPAKRW